MILIRPSKLLLLCKFFTSRGVLREAFLLKTLLYADTKNQYDSGHSN